MSLSKCWQETSWAVTATMSCSQCFLLWCDAAMLEKKWLNLPEWLEDGASGGLLHKYCTKILLEALIQFTSCNKTLAYKRGHFERAYMFYFLCLHTKKKKLILKKCMGWRWWGAMMSSQTSLFRMQIISEFLISINAWATLNAFNFQSCQAEE